MNWDGNVRAKGAFASVLLLLFSRAHVTNAVLPTAVLQVTPTQGDSYDLLATQAEFGTYPRMDPSLNPKRVVVKPPVSNSDLCEEVTEAMVSAFQDALPTTDPVLLFVPRGECSFEVKAKHAQQMGAEAIVIYNTLASRYGVNKTLQVGKRYPTYTEKDITYPRNLFDYDCAKGRAEVPAKDMKMDPLPYNAKHNDPLLTGTSEESLCFQLSQDHLQNCPSKQCLLTGKFSDHSNSMMEACCAWDLHVFLYMENATKPLNVSIPAAFVTYGQAERVLEDLEDGILHAVLSARHRPKYNPSSPLLWLLGVIVAATAAYMSAGDYHHMIRRANRPKAPSRQLPSGRTPSFSDGIEQNPSTLSQNRDEVDLSIEHAIGFVFMASAGLMVLFFLKIYSFMKVMYGFGCSNAMMQIIFYPLCRKIAKRSKVREFLVWRTNTEELGDITQLHLIAGFFSYAIGLTWLYVSLFVPHPQGNLFFWVVQDIMGACMCITFLSLIKLNSIRVATVLLVAFFVYDIFMVFLTPLIFNGKSVMITVATSGGPPEKDEMWCEKYPSDKGCQGGEPLPMLFTMPYFGDYSGGASMLGLGDIVVPGLLLSLAARLDAAKHLVGISSRERGSMGGTFYQECCSMLFCRGCYFPPTVVAYAIGLMMANVAVYVMRMGQPALLYLVPCTLGTMAFTAYRRNELRGLWEGPRILDAADQIVYGIESSRQPREPAEPEEADDVDPLLSNENETSLE